MKIINLSQSVIRIQDRLNTVLKVNEVREVPVTKDYLDVVTVLSGIYGPDVKLVFTDDEKSRFFLKINKLPKEVMIDESNLVETESETSEGKVVFQEVLDENGEVKNKYFIVDIYECGCEDGSTEESLKNLEKKINNESSVRENKDNLLSKSVELLSTAVKKVDNDYKTAISKESTDRTKAIKDAEEKINNIIKELEGKLENKVDIIAVPTSDYPDRKCIVLKNHDLLVGTDTTGTTYNLAMISKWDVADFGTNKLHSNINSLDRPTVQLPGQTGETAEKMAFISDLEKVQNILSEINERISALENK